MVLRCTSSVTHTGGKGVQLQNTTAA